MSINKELFEKASLLFKKADSLNSFKEAVDMASDAMGGNTDRAIDKLLIEYKNKHGSNPIVCLARQDMLNKHIIDFFRAYIDLDETYKIDYEYHPALHFLLKRKNFFLADYLISKGADITKIYFFRYLLDYKENNETVLEWIVDKIIDIYGNIDSFERKHEQYNLLGQCFAHNLCEAALFLLKKGANPFYIYKGKRVIDAIPEDKWAAFRTLKEEDFLAKQAQDDLTTCAEQH